MDFRHFKEREGWNRQRKLKMALHFLSKKKEFFKFKNFILNINKSHFGDRVGIF